MKFQKLFLCVDVVGRPGKEVSETRQQRLYATYRNRNCGSGRSIVVRYCRKPYMLAMLLCTQHITVNHCIGSPDFIAT